MHLHAARLCLDCEEVHDGLQCPICASETFVFLSRWVATPDRPSRPRQPKSSPEADVYRRLVGNSPPAKGKRFLKQGVVALTALGVISLLWKKRSDGSDRKEAPPPV